MPNLLLYSQLMKVRMVHGDVGSYDAQTLTLHYFKCAILALKMLIACLARRVLNSSRGRYEVHNLRKFDN